MNSNSELSMFVGGSQSVEEKEGYTNTAPVSNFPWYVLWTMLGVLAAMSIFSFPGNRPVKELIVLRSLPNVSAEELQTASSAFELLPRQIEGVVALERGENLSASKFDLGLNRLYLVTFENKAARDGFRAHPEYSRFTMLLNQLHIEEDQIPVDLVPR